MDVRITSLITSVIFSVFSLFGYSQPPSDEKVLSLQYDAGYIHQNRPYYLGTQISPIKISPTPVKGTSTPVGNTYNQTPTPTYIIISRITPTPTYSSTPTYKPSVIITSTPLATPTAMYIRQPIITGQILPTKILYPTNYPPPTIFLQSTSYQKPLPVFSNVITTAMTEASGQALLKRKEFETNLQSIKNENVKMTALKVDNKVSSMNQTHMTKMADALDNLNFILDKIASSGAQFKGAGVDTTSLDKTITTARNAIANAFQLISNQAGKVYVASISGELNLKNDMGKTVSEFTHDMTKVKESIMTAKQAVLEAARELSKLKGGQ